MSWSGTYGGAEPVRVNKWLAQSGVCSRREADELIAAGAVLIDLPERYKQTGMRGVIVNKVTAGSRAARRW